MEHLNGRVYKSIPGFEYHLERELGGTLKREPGGKQEKNPEHTQNHNYTIWGDRLYYSETANPVYWHQNCWLNPVKIEFNSINEAAAALRSLGRNWVPSFSTQTGRGKIIQSKLPPLSIKKRAFPYLVPDTPMGSYTILDANTIIASANCTSPFPDGVIEFEEDKINPPSRAYLKLYEALTLARKWPARGDRCLDAGASPGGWSWVLSKLGARVIAVDRAPLELNIDKEITVNNLQTVEPQSMESQISGDGEIHYLKHDAFTLKPEDIGKINWLFCDAAVYPARLYTWIKKWLESGLSENFVCTIKMQDSNPDPDTVKRFSEIPGSLLIHLYHNKHELCWIKTG